MQVMNFQRHPDSYLHWKLEVDGPVARLILDIQEDKGLKPGYPLKLNSYDLGVDMELSDAIQRLRFEHPDVRALVFSSALEKVFSSGANIYMLASSTHAFKVNFCKYTNETRLWLEEFARESGVRTIAALNGTASGGGYELAISCDEIHLIDDGSSAVSLPETPLLGVLPGTGGLTRLTDKRKIRRDLADVFCTLSEGCRGNKAKKWNLVDAVHPRSKFDDKIRERAAEVAEAGKVSPRQGPGITLGPVTSEVDENTLKYKYVTVEVQEDQRVATLTVHAPDTPQPTTPAEFHAAGDQSWALRMTRELDDALCQLRFVHDTVGLVLLKTRGDASAVLPVDHFLHDHQDDWLVREATLLLARTLRRLDLTGRSLFAILDEGSCFAGSLFEIALAADRSFMLDDPDHPVALQLGPLSHGLLPMSNGITRLEERYLGDQELLSRVRETTGRVEPADADALGLVTFAPDDIDWDDEVRVAIEERASFSPDALTGMEASLRFGGPETMETKIFGRLSAWQNWIFTRPNATGKTGALTLYGHPSRPSFDWKRT